MSVAQRAFVSKPCIYVTKGVSPSVTVYRAVANGDIPPIQTIAGSHTDLSQPCGIAVDDNREAYVANLVVGSQSNGSVTVYAAGAHGNVFAARTITGSNTLLFNPVGVALDANNSTYVANGANGNVAPIATIFGPNTGLNGPLGIALGETGKTYVVNAFNNSVSVYAAGANGNAAPLQTVMGSTSGLASPYGIAVRGSAMFVANGCSNTVIL